jgi:c-di-GMP-binding flagellar brake protein YcgR
LDTDDQKAVTSGLERRQYRRVKIVTQVRCAALDRDAIMVTRDISIGGMFINGDFPLPLDAETRLTFRLYPTEPAIACRAKVMYSRMGMGMGVQFLDLSEAASQSLLKFLNEAN